MPLVSIYTKLMNVATAYSTQHTRKQNREKVQNFTVVLSVYPFSLLNASGINLHKINLIQK